MLSVFDESYLHTFLDWVSNLRPRNPARGTLAISYVVLSREEQDKDMFTVKRAPALLYQYLQAFVVPMRARLSCKQNLYEQIPLARDVTLFTIAYRTTNEWMSSAERFPAYVPSTK